MVLSVIAVLALLVTAFASITRLERQASQNQLDAERARFLAWSGVERAKFELRRAMLTPGYPAPWMRYEPALIDTAGATTVPALETTGSSTAGQPDSGPSFRAFLSPLPQPWASPPASGAVPPWPSGFLGSSYYTDPANPNMLGDYYSLKVVDNNSLLYVNDANPNLQKMLETLMLEVGADTSKATQIIAARATKPEGFQHVSELRQILGTDYDKVSPFLTCHAWVNRRVIENTGTHGLRTGARAPVNINQAPFPVLVAVLYGISSAGVSAVDIAQAETLANAIIARRRASYAGGTGTGTSSGAVRYGFSGWGEFFEFLQTDGGLSNAQAAMILANCNPNTDLNKLVPDITIFRVVDKSDLTGATTEFCFNPCGVFTIESLGVVLNREGVPAAQDKVRSVVRVFERYHETSQLDFETDRLKTPAQDAYAGAPRYPALRDMTTLPEYRNYGLHDDLPGGTGGPELGLASYDGQIIFNAMTVEEVSLDAGTFWPFTGGFEVDGVKPEVFDPASATRVPPTAAGGVRVPPTGTGIHARSVVSGTLASPDFEHGSDLHPLGLLIGRGSRSLSVSQDDVIATTDHDVPKSEIWLTDGHGNVTSKIAEVPGYTYFAVDAHGFELWFKPDFSGVGGGTGTGTVFKQHLLTWEGAPPQEPGVPLVTTSGVSPEDFHEDVHEVWETNVENYLTAVRNGGPTGDPVISAPSGGISVDPPPPSHFYGSGLNPPYDGAAQFPYGTPSGDPGTGVGQTAEDNCKNYDGSGVDHSKLFADLIEAWYKTKFAEKINDEIEGASVSGSGKTWGAKGRLNVWLEGTGANTYQVVAEFDVLIEDPDGVWPPKEAEATVQPAQFTAPGGYNAVYHRKWTYTTPIAAGTWHHVLFSFWAVPPAGSPHPPEHTNLFVDGHPVNPGPEGQWPTELHPQARYVKDVLDSLQGGAIDFSELDFDIEEYRVPIEFSRGALDSRIGADREGSNLFRGLVDNIIFQGNWPKTYDTAVIPADPMAGLRRFDFFRPSKGDLINASDDPHVFFTKRTPAMEWDKPITILGYDWTAWKYNVTTGSGVVNSSLDLGMI